VYLYLLRKRDTCGVREVQRALGFSSSSSAHYHLEKLVDQGVLTKDSYGNYRINQNAKVEMLSSFLIIHGFPLPKQLIYATVTTAMSLFLVAFYWASLTPTSILALLPGVVASAIFWYETLKIWRSLPSFKK
jgi:predicted transcriptional regulator